MNTELSMAMRRVFWEGGHDCKFLDKFLVKVKKHDFSDFEDKISEVEELSLELNDCMFRENYYTEQGNKEKVKEVHENGRQVFFELAIGILRLHKLLVQASLFETLPENLETELKVLERMRSREEWGNDFFDINNHLKYTLDERKEKFKKFYKERVNEQD
jgi:hypothetical protein